MTFLGRSYTLPTVRCCSHVDETWDWSTIKDLPPDERIDWLKKQNVDTFIHVFPDKLIAQWAKKAQVKQRIGNAHALTHWTTCNSLPSYTRKRSDLHESQLNTKLLAPLGINESFSLSELGDYAGFTRLPPLPEHLRSTVNTEKRTVILHPKSRGSAPEWPIENYVELAKILDPNIYQLIFTGTAEESASFREKIPAQKNITDLSGQLSLDDLIALISASDCLVAASTGPLHIAGLCGINTVGLYRDERPVHPRRWSPLGKRVNLVLAEQGHSEGAALNIIPSAVKSAIEGLL